MTCIVGWVEENKRKGTRDVWIGGDSAGVGGYEIRTRSDEKVFRNGPMLIGYTSSFRMGQLLRYSLVIPEHRTKKKTDHEYMCTDFVDAVMKLFEDKKYGKVKSGEQEGGSFLVGYNGKLYAIYDDFQVAEQSLNFESVGCGEQIAVGALYATRNIKMSPRKRVMLALEAAEEMSAGVRGPFVIKKLGG